MIRMGRSQKPEPSSDSAPPINQTYPNAGTSLAPNRAVTESESMARDIKEGRLSGFIGSGTVLTGDTSFQAMLRIDGHLTGSISSETGTLIVGSTGIVDANITVASAMINGTVKGDITVSERLELGRTAHVVGNIQTPRLVIEDGAILEGNSSMIKAKAGSEQRIAEAGSPKYTTELAPFETDESPLYIERSEIERAEATTAN